MYKIAIFAEDFGHETVLKTLIQRVAKQNKIEVSIRVYSASGGNRIISELKQYLRDLRLGIKEMPEILVVARDANCKGCSERCDEIHKVVKQYEEILICAIPDPHIERWLLLDSGAFKAVLGKGCKAPDQKCNRDRYKELYCQAIRDTGIEPNLSGMEHAEDIVSKINLEWVEKQDKSLGKFLQELKRKLGAM